MAACCSAQQVAEAVLIWSSNTDPNPSLCVEFEQAEALKCLDLFISTLDVFTDAFECKMQPSYIKGMKRLIISKRCFIYFLKPRGVLLSERNSHFDLLLTCTYFSALVSYLAFNRKCFHFARVACKLLTEILEERFTEVFKTRSGWECLISYCKNIHAAVYPSKKNRPPGYKPDFVIISEKVAASKERNPKKADLDDKFEDKIADQKGIECGKHKEHFRDELLGLVPEKEGIVGPSDLKEEALDSQSKIDGATYWHYENLDTDAICERLTDNLRHLEDVYNLLKELEQARPESGSSSNSDISSSDNEYIEALEEKVREPSLLPERNVKNLAPENREMNEAFGVASGEDQMHPEESSDDEILGQLALMRSLDPYQKCQVCYGKMRSFRRNWKTSFLERYSNSDIVTGLI